MQPVLSPYDGVLLVDKPKRLTSHDVIDKIRRRFKLRKVGHCGTLDPIATGLLVVVVERATKLQNRLMSDDKTYEGTMQLGITTDSQDADGKVLSEKPPAKVTEEEVEMVFSSFRGDLQQIPPMISAIKHKGKPLYKLARQGKTIEREPRLIHIYDLRLLRLRHPFIEFRVSCSKGTYVRTLCSDIGDLLGCGAHLAELRRIRSGDFDIKDTHSLDDLLALNHEQLQEQIIPILKLFVEPV